MIAERGSAVVEFALVLPLVLIVLLGIVEVAVVARSEIQLVHAAREGAREAAVSPDTSRAVAAVRAALGPLGDSARVSVRRSAHIGDKATVSVSLRHAVAAPVFGGYTVDLRAQSTMRIER
ncbi:MAG: TadE family type IV pilus minor pilin [Actinomycetota bacterium]